MNPLTLDFIRRWKWLLLAQFVVTALTWVSHATQPKDRLHLEMFVAVAMSWDLARGLVRAQVGLPQERPGITAGLWFSVVGVGMGVQTAAMLGGGAVLAPLLGQAVDPGVLGMHVVFGVLLMATVQFILTFLPYGPLRMMAQPLKGGVVGTLWGLPMFGAFLIARFGPASWQNVSVFEGWVMGLLGGLRVASWFTTKSMMSERAMPKNPSDAVEDVR